MVLFITKSWLRSSKMLKIETIAKNFKIFWSLQSSTQCVYAYRELRAWLLCPGKMKRLKATPSESYEFSSTHFLLFIIPINNSARKHASCGSFHWHFASVSKVSMEISSDIILNLRENADGFFHRYFASVSKMSMEISNYILVLDVKEQWKFPSLPKRQQETIFFIVFCRCLLKAGEQLAIFQQIW